MRESARDTSKDSESKDHGRRLCGSRWSLLAFTCGEASDLNDMNVDGAAVSVTYVTGGGMGQVREITVRRRYDESGGSDSSEVGRERAARVAGPAPSSVMTASKPCSLSL